MHESQCPLIAATRLSVTVTRPEQRKPDARSESSNMDLPPVRPRSKPLPQLTGEKSGDCAVLGVLRRAQTFHFLGFATNLADRPDFELNFPLSHLTPYANSVD